MKDLVAKILTIDNNISIFASNRVIATGETTLLQGTQLDVFNIS